MLVYALLPKVPPAPMVRVEPSVPARVRVLFDVRVLPSRMVKVDEVAGAVSVTLLMVVAEATPNTGVTRVGLTLMAKVFPVPVCAPMLVAFPTEVIGPVMFALVVTFVASVASVAVLAFPVSAPTKLGAVTVPEVSIVAAETDPVKVGLAKGA